MIISGRGKRNCSGGGGGDLSKCYFVHDIHNMDWPKPDVSDERPATNSLVHGTAWQEMVYFSDVHGTTEGHQSESRWCT
jgi:hypothetical protein